MPKGTHFQRPSFDQQFDILSRYESGESSRTIAADHKIDRSSVTNIVLRLGGIVRSSGKNNRLKEYEVPTKTFYQVHKNTPMPPKDFYVYLYLRQKDFTPYYVGKGSGYRAFTDDHYVKVPYDKNRVVIVDGLSEVWALILERQLISWYGRKNNNTGILRNLTNGGEGISGYKHTEETKSVISKSSKNRPATNKNMFAWSNGDQVVYSYEQPSEEWTKGNAKNRGKKIPFKKRNMKNKKWFNNGSIQKRLYQAPDETWKAGRLENGLLWWNNGQKNTRAFYPPDETWKAGRIRR